MHEWKAKMQHYYFMEKDRDRHENEVRNKRRTVSTRRRRTTAAAEKERMVRVRVSRSLQYAIECRKRVMVDSAITVCYPTTKNRKKSKQTKKLE